MATPIFKNPQKDAEVAQRERKKRALMSRFVELFKQAAKTNPGVDWVIEHWGGIRGEHPEWEHRFSPIGFVVWAATGQQPTLRDEIDALDSELGFDIASLSISQACEEQGDNDRRSLRAKLISLL